jgi:hypothetical protein
MGSEYDGLSGFSFGSLSFWIVVNVIIFIVIAIIVNISDNK